MMAENLHQGRFYILLSFILIFPKCMEKLPNTDFQAVVISDIHVSNDPSKINRLNLLIDKINQNEFPGLKLLVVTGDIVSCVYGSYTLNNPDTSDNRIRKGLGVFSRSKVPVHLVLGNHDYKIGRDRDSDSYFPEQEILMMERIWAGQAGINSYSSIDYEGWNFIFLNSMRGRHLHRHFDDNQLSWLERQLENGKPTVLFFHHPLKTDHLRFWCGPKDLITPEKEPNFYRIISQYRQLIKSIFVGHGHAWVRDTLFDNIKVYETSSFGDSNELPFYQLKFLNSDSSIQVIKNNKTIYSAKESGF